MALLAALLASWWAPAIAHSDDNLYARDLAAAKRGLDGAQGRLDRASRDLQRASAMLPRLRAETARLDAIAARRRQVADDATATARQAERAVHERRERAAREVDATRAQRLAATTTWRHRRSLWISSAIALLGICAAFGLAALAAHQRKDEAQRGAAAARTASALGVAVATYLAALGVLLWWADAWRASWGAAAIAALGVMAMIAGTGTGWRSGAPLPRHQLLRMIVLPAVLFMVAAAVPGAVAASSARPDAMQVANETLRLATQAHAHAAMPRPIARLAARAEELSTRALRALQRADEMQRWRDRIAAAHANADQRRRGAERSVAHWGRQLDIAQADYDAYQELTDAIATPPPGVPSRVPSYVPPVFDPPTTRDFGSGSGSIGTCADGTLSDSIGRPGACSHHGGVGSR
jgi:hypothetical protein